MPVHIDTKTVERQETETTYECDAAECGTASKYRGDLNYLALNPRPAKEKVDHDGVMILCDDHLNAALTALSDFIGAELHDAFALRLDSSIVVKNGVGAGIFDTGDFK